MTEQINYGMAALFQAMASQQIPPIQTGKADTGEVSDFQKLLDQKTQSAQTESRPKEKAETSKTDKETKVNDKSEDKAETEEQTPVQNQGSPQTVVDPQVQAVQDNRVIVGRFVNDGTTQEIRSAVFDTETETWHWETFEVGRFVPKEDAVFGRIESVGVQPRMMQEQAQVQPEAVETVQAPAEEEVQFAETLQNAQPELQTQPKTQYTAETTPMQSAAQETGEEETVTVDVSAGAKPVFHDVEAAPIKVGEAPAAEQSEAPDVGEQLAVPLTNALAQGESRVTVRLNPETLGSVEIEITQSANGALRVALTAASSETRSLLEKHAANLQTMLGSRGQENVQVEVQRQEESQQSQDHSYDGHSGNQGQQQEQRRQRHTQSGEDFLQQLRLGLIPMDTSAS